MAFGPPHVSGAASFLSTIFLNNAALTFLWLVFKHGECCECSPSAYMEDATVALCLSQTECRL